jgi:hypothetical protein
MARTLAERQRAHEQSKARLAEAEAKLKLDERRQRTRRLIEAGALVEKAALLELDSNALYGALLSLRDRGDDRIAGLSRGPVREVGFFCAARRWRPTRRQGCRRNRHPSVPRRKWTRPGAGARRRGGDGLTLCRRRDDDGATTRRVSIWTNAPVVLAKSRPNRLLSRDASDGGKVGRRRTVCKCRR